MRMRMMDRVSIERTSKLKAFVFLRIFGFLGSLFSFVKMVDVLRMDFFFWLVSTPIITVLVLQHLQHLLLPLLPFPSPELYEWMDLDLDSDLGLEPDLEPDHHHHHLELAEPSSSQQAIHDTLLLLPPPPLVHSVY